MGGCGRQWCSVCDEELIHRDHRKFYESSSALGQIVWREGPVNVTVCDLDLASRKGLSNGFQLVRLVEQKQPDHTLRAPQARLLFLLDACLGHCASCPGAVDLQIDKRSGLLLVHGHIAASTRARHETIFDGPQTVEHVRTKQRIEVLSHEEFFRVLDPEDSQRRHGNGWKRTS
jgi:hypothetical protein